MASGSATQAGVQLAARSLAQQGGIPSADLESAYKLYATNAGVEERMLKVEANSVVSSSANAAVSSSSTNGVSSSSHGQKPRTKKPAVNFLQLAHFYFLFLANFSATSRSHLQ